MSILQEADFKAKVPVFNSMAWGLMEGSVEVAERDFLKPLLGAAEYDTLVTASASLPYSGNALALYNELKAPLAQMAAYFATYDLDVNITSRGFVVRKTEEEAPASQTRVENFRQSQLRKAMSGFDALLEWLEDNKATYTDWSAGEGYTELKQGFVNTTAEFQDKVDIGNSRYLFMRLRPYRRRVEDKELKTTLGTALYNEIKAEIVADSISSDNQTLLPMIHDAVANRAMARGIVMLNLQPTEIGYLMQGIQHSQTMKMPKQGKNEHIDSLVKQMNADADQAFQDLVKYLNANATSSTYANFFTSDQYVAPDDDEDDDFDRNTDADASIFIM